MKVTLIRFVSVALSSLFLVSSGASQSFNIDIDIEGGPPYIGNGAPSGAFGGAANQPGHWERIGGLLNYDNLRDVTGALTSVDILGPWSAGLLGYNNPINTGDYALLLNDGQNIGIVGAELRIQFLGLQNGDYRLITYAAAPQGDLRPTRIAVAEATNGTSQICSGPMPGNQLIHGITHTIHEVKVINNQMNFEAVSLLPSTNSFLLGMQLAQVPEPTTFFALFSSVCCSVFICKRKKTVYRRNSHRF